MQVHHAVDAVVGVLEFDEVDDSAEIVAEVQIARRLDARKNQFFCSHFTRSQAAGSAAVP
jgi:hypothetical protein